MTPPFWKGFAAAFMRELKEHWFGLSAVITAAFLSTYFNHTGWFAP